MKPRKTLSSGCAGGRVRECAGGALTPNQPVGTGLAHSRTRLLDHPPQSGKAHTESVRVKALRWPAFICFLALVLVRYAAAQTPVAPPAGLVSWWPGDEDAHDIVGGHHGTLENGATYAKGMVGPAFSLDGVDDFVRVPSSPALNPKHSFSIDAWIFPTAGGFFHIVAKWGDGGSWGGERAYSFHTLTGMGLRFAISDDENQGNAGYHDFDTPSNVTRLSTWNFVACVYDQPTGARRIYVDGAQVAERVDPPITVKDSVADLGIGAHLGAPNAFDCVFPGLIDEVEIFNRSLSTSEIRTLFQAGSAGKSKRSPPKSTQDLVTWVQRLRMER